MSKTRSLNPRPSLKEKLIRFADLYRGSPNPDIRGNKAACYREIHPRSKKISSVGPKACEYFNHPIVQERLKEALDAIGRKSDITQERVLREVARLAFYDVRRLVDDDNQPIAINKLEDGIAAAIVGVKVTTVLGNEDSPAMTRYEYKLADKNTAAEKLMKHLGMFEKDNDQRAKSLTELLQEVRSNE
jgi:hypothetical protein